MAETSGGGGIARTSATGTAMLPELVAWSSSLSHDRAFAREDLLGSAAHATMLARTKLVPEADAKALRDALLSMFDAATAGTLVIADGEEDVHMAVEAELARRLGPAAGRLHTARSRNDQVALDLRLHVRAAAALALAEIAELAGDLADRAAQESAVILPAYTHRQRAQPISASFLIAAWAEQLLRAADVVRFALDRANVLPLGSGACSGTSLPIDRPMVARLLAFPRLTENALDAVGDRDFALDWAWAGARTCLALARLSTDVIDFSTTEFGFVRLDGEISAGSSMMPQKKNPDVFELVRGKSSRAIGHVAALLTLVKGLASGYNRDQQDDRESVLGTGPLVMGALRAVRISLPHVHFVPEKCAAAVADGSTQATDLAEAMVREGTPFREAYKAVGALVRRAADEGKTLRAIEPHAALDPARAVAAKESPGGTGPRAVAAHLESIRARANVLADAAGAIPSLDALAAAVAAEPLTS